MPDENALESKIAGDVSQATAAAQASLNTQIAELSSQLLGASEAYAARMEAAAAKITPPVAAPAFSEEQFAAQIDAEIERNSGKVGPGVVKAFREAVPAILNSQAASNASIQKQLALADPALRDAKGVPLLKRYEKEIAAFVKSEGITDGYLGTKGYNDIVTLIAARDPAFAAERKEAVIAEYRAAQEKEGAKPRPTTATEGVHVGQVTAPNAAALSEEAQIAAIKVDDEQATLLQKRYRLTKADVQRQKHEIAKEYERYGAEGIRQLGGIPVADLNSLTMEAPLATRAQRLVKFQEAD